MAKRYMIDEPDDSSWDLDQERAFWEKMLNQKINFFLAFFVILIVGASLARTKELTLFILSVGAVILWVLTVSIINTTRKINLAVKELSKSARHATGIVDRKAKGRITRLVLGFGLPIFLASVVTLIFLAGLSGLYTFNFPNKPEVIQSVQTTIEKGKESLIDKKPSVGSNDQHFERVDSVIIKSKSIQVSVPLDTTNYVSKQPRATVKNPQVTPKEPQVTVNPNFKSIDKVISGSEAYSATPKVSTRPARQKQSQVNDPNFKSIDKVISTTENALPQVQQIKPVPKQEAVKKPVPNDPHFKSIDKVISTREKD